jgi:hypothetical protein
MMWSFLFRHDFIAIINYYVHNLVKIDVNTSMLLVTNIYLNDTLDVTRAPVAFLLVLIYCVKLPAEVGVLAGLENDASCFSLAYGATLTLDVNFFNTLSGTRRLPWNAIFFSSCLAKSRHKKVLIPL